MRRILKLASLLAIAAVAGFTPAGHAADPDGVLTAQKPVYSFEETGVTGVSVMNNVNSETDGAVTNCYSAELEPHLCVVKEIEYKGSIARPVLFQSQFEVHSDYDMYLYDAKGVQLAESATGITTQSTGEQFQVRLAPGRYRLEFVKYYAVHSTLKGTVTLK